MKRRGFFKSLAALAGAASVSPLVFLPKFDPVRWRVIQPSKLVVNPAYLQAAFEYLSANPGGYWSVDLRKFPREADPNYPLPLRYTLIDPETFEPIFIPARIKQ